MSKSLSTKPQDNELFAAVKSGNLELLKERRSELLPLSTNGRDEPQRDSEGLTFFLLACEYRHQDIVSDRQTHST